MRHFVLYRAAPFLPKKRRGKSMLNMLFDRGCALILSCFFKSRTKCSRQGTSERLGRRKAAKRPVRYRLCGELIRGLQNLETPCKGDDFTFFLLLQKEPKSSRDFVLRPRFKALQRNAFYRNCSGSCLKQFLGFEPVQKVCCTSDARPMSFEMGCCSTSSQEQMYSKRGAARYFCCSGNLFLRYVD